MKTEKLTLRNNVSEIITVIKNHTGKLQTLSKHIHQKLFHKSNIEKEIFSFSFGLISSTLIYSKLMSYLGKQTRKANAHFRVYQ